MLVTSPATLADVPLTLLAGELSMLEGKMALVVKVSEEGAQSVPAEFSA